MAVNSHAVNSKTLNGSGRSRFVYLSAESQFSIESIAQYGVIMPFNGDAVIDITSDVTGTREHRPVAAGYVDIAAENSSLLHTHGFRTDSNFGFEPRQANFDVLISAGQQETSFAFNTVKALPLEELFVARLGFESESESSRTVNLKAYSAFDVSVEDSVTGFIYRQMAVDNQIRISSVAEPAINGVHEATARSAFDFFATSDEALVRSNSLGDASIKINALLDDAGVNMRHAGRVNNEFGFDSQGEIYVNSMMSASSTFRVHSVSAGWTRWTGFRSNRAFAFDNRQSTSRAIRRFFAADQFRFTSEQAVITRIIGLITQSTIAITSNANAIRRVEPNAQTSFGFTSNRARALSNLTQPAADCRTFIIEEREIVFTVPEEEREFIVWC